MLISAWAVAAFFAALASAALAGWAVAARRWVYPVLQASESDSAPVPDLAVLVACFALGAGAFLSLSILIGIAHGYNGWAQSVPVAAGLFFLARFKNERRLVLRFEGVAPCDAIWLLFPVLYFLARIFSAGLPQQHNDALYYHLAAPKLWAELGKIALTPEHPSYAQASFWETIYGLPQFFLGTRGAFAHVATQLFGQWMHVLWGQFGVLFAGAAILRAFAPELRKRSGLTIFLAWLCTTLPCVEWTGGLAKNDYVAAFFAMAAVISLTAPSRGSRVPPALLCGLLAGWAFATKMSAACTVVALPVLVFSLQAKGARLRAFAFYALGCAIAAVPVFFRNALFTGNPFFPMFDAAIGPGWLSSWWIDHNASFGGVFKPHAAMVPWIVDRLFEKSLPKILLALGLLATAHPLLVGSKTRWRERRLAHAKWGIFFALQLVFVAMSVRAAADGRYGGYALSLLLIFLLAPLAEAVARSLSSPSPSPLQRAVYLLVPLGLLLNSPVDLIVKVPRDYWREPAEKYVDQFHAYQESKNWMDANIPAVAAKESTVVALADKANFYLDVPFETFAEMKKWELVLAASADARDFLKRLKAEGYRFFFMQTHFVYPPAIQPMWSDLMALAKELAVFSGQSVVVLDLGRLP